MASREIFPKDAVKVLLKLGFFVVRQKGSHVRLWHPDNKKGVTIAIHPKSLSLGTLHSILKQAAVSKKEFENVL